MNVLDYVSRIYGAIYTAEKYKAIEKIAGTKTNETKRVNEIE